MNNILSISAIAISLTFDTLAVSVSSGIREKNMKFQRGVIISSILAIIQAIVPNSRLDNRSGNQQALGQIYIHYIICAIDGNKHKNVC